MLHFAFKAFLGRDHHGDNANRQAQAALDASPGRLMHAFGRLLPDMPVRDNVIPMKIGMTLLRRAGAMLCIALLFVFGQAAVASSVGIVQHAVSGHHAHHHMLFADVTVTVDHADHDGDAHPDADAGDHHDGEKDADHPVGHHHHHGDLGSSSLVLASLTSSVPAPHMETPVLVPQRLSSDPRNSLPDRPPRSFLRSV